MAGTTLANLRNPRIDHGRPGAAGCGQGQPLSLSAHPWHTRRIVGAVRDTPRVRRATLPRRACDGVQGVFARTAPSSRAVRHPAQRTACVLVVPWP